MREALFGRSCRLILGTTQLLLADAATPALAFRFQVTKNLKAEPNKVEIKVRNLALATRKMIEQPKTIPVQLDVGHGSNLHTIYYGEMRNAVSEREDTDIVTTISSGDKESCFSSGRILVNVPAKMSPSQILTMVGNFWIACGVGEGNLKQAAVLATATFGGPARVLHGSLSKITTDICRANGFEWSIQNGSLQIVPIGSNIGTTATAVSLSSTSGLVGSPSVDSKGILTAKALIQPELWPGAPVVIDAEFIKGAYRIEEVEFVGDTWGNDWYCHLTGRKWPTKNA